MRYISKVAANSSFLTGVWFSWGTLPLPPTRVQHGSSLNLRFLFSSHQESPPPKWNKINNKESFHSPGLHSLFSECPARVASSDLKGYPQNMFSDHPDPGLPPSQHSQPLTPPIHSVLKEMGIPDHLTCLLRNLHAGQEATVRTGHGTTHWFQLRKGVCQGCILSPCLFNSYAEYIMRNAGLEEAQAGIKIAGRNIKKLRYADGTTLWQKVQKN